MKKFKLVAAVAACALASTSCQKDMMHDNGPEKESRESTLILSIEQALTKASGTSHGDQSKDNTVNTLDIFIFRNNQEEDNGSLDTYKRFSKEELGSLTGLQIKTTTGKKTIVAVANAHRDNWSGITCMDDFKAMETSIKQENAENFLMTGSKDTELDEITEVSLNLSRMVARICLDKISINFEDSPYEEMKLTNVQAYLANVTGNKIIFDGSDCEEKTILNNGGLVESDTAGNAMKGLIHENIGKEISQNEPYAGKHYFYCYENAISSETGSEKFTRLVIQAELNGETYYYPVNINQEGAGHDESSGHYGVKRNTSYTIGITINRPGSADPDVPVTHGTLDMDLIIQDWETVPRADIIF